jgi:hypothetical protein
VPSCCSAQLAAPSSAPGNCLLTVPPAACVLFPAGIFVLTGLAARDIAGPAVIVSYLISGIACLICALCYAEFATEVGGGCRAACSCSTDT